MDQPNPDAQAWKDLDAKLRAELTDDEVKAFYSKVLELQNRYGTEVLIDILETIPGAVQEARANGSV